MTSSITVEPYETVEFSDSDTDSWQVVDPFDSENDDVITTESDVITSDEDEDDDVDEDEDVDVVVDDVIPTESDVVLSEDDVYDEDEEEEDDDEDDDDVITSEDEVEDDDDDVITSEDEEEEDDDDVITPMSSDEITNHTQGLNKAAAKFEGLYNVEISDAMKEDAYFERIQLERALYEVEEEEEDEDEEDYDEEDLDDELIPRWLNNKFERQRMRKLGKKVYPKMKKSKRMVNQYNRPGCAGAKHGLGLKHNLI